ncbi:hypothetical protein BS329_32765 [Amycolatopsis coloradensis]|uniref:Uncharacterized protein n=1 Tax=Amycolatopsis coloradensis TaxID=76021 RepID=A0A1R0KHI9_9PSEU|nr:hypothetical protein BS329_32765 [Amycolatopsis coloradensis]
MLFDQRGRGRSTPHASDPVTGLRHTTTDQLVTDLERLLEPGKRVHIGPIGEWELTFARVVHPVTRVVRSVQMIVSSAWGSTSWRSRLH